MINIFLEATISVNNCYNKNTDVLYIKKIENGDDIIQNSQRNRIDESRELEEILAV